MLPAKFLYVLKNWPSSVATGLLIAVFCGVAVTQIRSQGTPAGGTTRVPAPRVQLGFGKGFDNNGSVTVITLPPPK